MRAHARLTLVLLLALAIPVSGCVSVIPGYSFFGVPINQDQRDDESFAEVFFWNEVPDPPHESFNPGVLALDVVTSVALDASVLLVYLGIAALLSAGDDDSGHDRHERHGKEHDERHRHTAEPALAGR